MSQVYLLAAVDQVMVSKIKSACELESTIAQGMNVLHLKKFRKCGFGHVCRCCPTLGIFNFSIV